MNKFKVEEDCASEDNKSRLFRRLNRVLDNEMIKVMLVKWRKEVKCDRNAAEEETVAEEKVPTFDHQFEIPRYQKKMRNAWCWMDLFCVPLLKNFNFLLSL